MPRLGLVFQLFRRTARTREAPGDDRRGDRLRAHGRAPPPSAEDSAEPRPQHAVDGGGILIVWPGSTAKAYQGIRRGVRCASGRRISISCGRTCRSWARRRPRSSGGGRTSPAAAVPWRRRSKASSPRLGRCGTSTRSREGDSSTKRTNGSGGGSSSSATGSRRSSSATPMPSGRPFSSGGCRSP